MVHFTAATSTQLDITIGPSTSTDDHRVRLKTIHVYEVENYLTLEDASNFNNDDSQNADGSILVTGDTP